MTPIGQGDYYTRERDSIRYGSLGGSGTSYLPVNCSASRGVIVSLQIRQFVRWLKRSSYEQDRKNGDPEGTAWDSSWMARMDPD